MTDMDYREGDQYFVPDFQPSVADAPVEESPPTEEDADELRPVGRATPVEEMDEPQVTVEGVPQPDDDVDAWGLSRNEWVNHPSLSIAHGPPRVDETGEWYDCRESECEASYPSISGLLMHRNRQHVSEKMKKERFDKMSKAHRDAAKRRREAQNEMSPYVAEDPEVQAILAQTLVRGSREFEARRKRWSKAKGRMTEGEFAIKELNRAIALAADPSILDEDDAPPTKRPKATKKVDEAAQADDLFERVGRATDVLFPNGVDGAHILPVAELQKDMLALMQGVKA